MSVFFSASSLLSKHFDYYTHMMLRLSTSHLKVMVRTRMLEEGEEGLGSEENEPPIMIDAEVKVLSINSTHL